MRGTRGGGGETDNAPGVVDGVGTNGDEGDVGGRGEEVKEVIVVGVDGG